MRTSCGAETGITSSTPGCDKTAAAPAHKYGGFTSNRIPYNRGDLAYNIVFNIKMRDIKFFFYLWSFSNLFLIKKQKTFKFVKSACTLCDVSSFFFFL